MERPIRLLILLVTMALCFVPLMLAGWENAKLPNRVALVEGISTVLFWIVVIGTAATGIWIAGGI